MNSIYKGTIGKCTILFPKANINQLDVVLGALIDDEMHKKAV